MSTKRNTKKLFIIIVWFFISAIITFSVTASIALNAKTEEKYTNLIEAELKLSDFNNALMESLENGFTSLSTDFGNEFGDEFFALYAANRPNRESLSVQSSWDLKEMQELASKSLSGLVVITVILCVLSIAGFFVIVQKGKG
ncbi:MAG: hypothetical protein FWH07_03630 [Oscillospiraceae bacterium]|nr:hypothetical protein [Oscillospiraceae bacterium]